ncbi:hypothetical protein CRYUN_Cryun04dG0134000 [Craigia yunnanensis]
MSGSGKQDDEPMIFPPLYQTFHSRGYILSNTPEKVAETSILKRIMSQLEIHMVRGEEDDNKKYRLAIRPCPPNH